MRQKVQAAISLSVGTDSVQGKSWQTTPLAHITVHTTATAPDASYSPTRPMRTCIARAVLYRRMCAWSLEHTHVVRAFAWVKYGVEYMGELVEIGVT